MFWILLIMLSSWYEYCTYAYATSIMDMRMHTSLSLSLYIYIYIYIYMRVCIYIHSGRTFTSWMSPLSSPFAFLFTEAALHWTAAATFAWALRPLEEAEAASCTSSSAISARLVRCGFGSALRDSALWIPVSCWLAWISPPRCSPSRISRSMAINFMVPAAWLIVLPCLS